MRHGYKTLYDPELKVLHEASASTKKKTSNKLEQRRVRLKYEIESTRIVIKEINEHGRYYSLKNNQK